MPVLKLSQEEAQSIVWQEHERAKIIRDTITGTSRWSINHRLVFELDGKFYETPYSKAATENQDEQPFAWTKEVTCKEVRPTEITITEYLPVAD